MLTRVGTFSIILIIHRSRTPGSLQPLGSFLFTGVAVKELTSPTSLRYWICFRGGNDDRNPGNYSSPTKLISNAISFVNPFYGAVVKNARAGHTRWHKMC